MGLRPLVCRVGPVPGEAPVLGRVDEPVGKTRRQRRAVAPHRDFHRGGPVCHDVADEHLAVSVGHAVDISTAVDARIAFVRGAEVVDERVLRSPVPHRDDQISFHAARPRRRHGHLAARNAIRPVGKHPQRPLTSEGADRRTHLGAPKAGLDTVVPCGRRRVEFREFERARLGLEGPRMRIAELMAILAPLLKGPDPRRLIPHPGHDTVAVGTRAREFVPGRHLHQRHPVVGGIDLRGFLRRLRDHRFQCDFGITRCGCDRTGVGQPVPSNPHAVGRLRQFREHELPLVAGDDDLDELGRQVVRFGDDPHAGFATLRAFDDAADVPVGA